VRALLTRRLCITAIAGAAALAGPGRADPFHLLTDAELVAYAATPVDVALAGKRVVLGLHHGLPVIADFPCGEPCPATAARIIHYEIGPGAPCAVAGGVSVTRPVPYRSGDVETQFCAPKPLANR
jgi:hypothetical protein